ncbi:MAG: hypothetical protein ACRDGD_05075 [Candidatus Limnocylindria bacterium]
MTWARLAFRLQRSSIGFAALVCLGLAALGAWLALSLPSMLANCNMPNRMDQCGTVYLFGSPMGDPALLFYLGIGVAMYAVPVVLGAPLLPSEVERRTAMIAWPLARSRMGWLAWRAGSVLVIGVVLVGIMAVAAEAVARANLAEDGVESRELAEAERSGYAFTTGLAYRAPDGTPISEDEANAIRIAAGQEYSPDFPPESILPKDVSYGIAGSRYHEVLVRESAVLVGATVLAGGVAAFVVSRRRPE